MIYIYAFYVDVFFVQNFCMNAMVLFLAAILRKNGGRGRTGKLLLVSLLGTGLETVLLLAVGSYLLFLLLSHLMVLPAMTVFAYGRKRLREFGADYLTCLSTTVMLGGMTNALENLTGIDASVLLTGGVSFLLAWFGIRFLYEQVRRQRNLYPVHLEDGGRQFDGKGLLDTGNMLTEPLSRRAVHIISKEAAEQLALKRKGPDSVIPFSSLGKEDGILEGYVLDQLTVWKGKGKITCGGALVGVAPDWLLEGKDYQMILHSGIFQERGIT